MVELGLPWPSEEEMQHETHKLVSDAGVEWHIDKVRSRPCQKMIKGQSANITGCWYERNEAQQLERLRFGAPMCSVLFCPTSISVPNAPRVSRKRLDGS